MSDAASDGDCSHGRPRRAACAGCAAESEERRVNELLGIGGWYGRGSLDERDRRIRKRFEQIRARESRTIEREWARQALAEVDQEIANEKLRAIEAIQGEGI